MVEDLHGVRTSMGALMSGKDDNFIQREWLGKRMELYRLNSFRVHRN